IIAKGFTPIPYKIVTIAAGLARFDLLQFFIASALTRSARFFLVAALIKRFGAEFTELMEKRFYLVSSIVIGLIVIGLLAVHFMGH
ncbi:MAG: DedA family protein, partial [Asticcacaulis sp.]|nr:DedA family protein [Asticcacaulis sp.]